MKNYVDTEITYHKEIAPQIYEMGLKSENMVQTALCGQFVHIRVSHENLHILRRPISICRINKEKNEIVIVYGVVGKGTKILAEKKPGEKIEVLGPLGNGFQVSPLKEAILIGGGIGTPPLLELAYALKKANTETVKVYLGYRKDPILVKQFEAICDEVYVATEDGSVGHKGYVTSLLEEKANENSEIFACGPKPLLKAVQAYAKKNSVLSQLSTEERMGCGIGACLVCTCKVKDETNEEKFHYERVCKEGPVFSGNEIIFD